MSCCALKDFRFQVRFHLLFDLMLLDLILIDHCVCDGVNVFVKTDCLF